MRGMLTRAGLAALFGAGVVVGASVSWTVAQGYRDRWNAEDWQVRRL